MNIVSFCLFQVKYAEVLLKYDANPNIETPDPYEPLLCSSVRQGHLKMVKLLIEHEANLNGSDIDTFQSPLHHCALLGHIEIAKELLAAGADPNEWDILDCSPLYLAFSAKSWEMVELLLPHSDLNLMDHDGHNALHYVLKNCHEPLAERCLSKLMELGVDLNARTRREGHTPLDLAANYLHAGGEFFFTLLKAGCDLEAKTKQGETVLHVVAWNKGGETPTMAAEMMETLIKAGADIDCVSDHGRTPLMDAVRSASPRMVRLLLQANCSCKMTKFPDDRQVVKFMRQTILDESEDCATFLFGDSWSLPEDQDLREHYYNLSLTPGASDLGDTIELSRPPTSLYRLCRLALRALLPKGLAFLRAVEELPLAPHVRDFVALRPATFLSCHLSTSEEETE